MKPERQAGLSLALGLFLSSAGLAGHCPLPSDNTNLISQVWSDPTNGRVYTPTEGSKLLKVRLNSNFSPFVIECLYQDPRTSKTYTLRHLVLPAEFLGRTNPSDWAEDGDYFECNPQSNDCSWEETGDDD